MTLNLILYVDSPSPSTEEIQKGQRSFFIITDDLCPWLYNQPGHFQSIKLMLEF
jgi:hypothetical protein